MGSHQGSIQVDAHHPIVECSGEMPPCAVEQVDWEVEISLRPIGAVAVSHAEADTCGIPALVEPDKAELGAGAAPAHHITAAG